MNMFNIQFYINAAQFSIQINLLLTFQTSCKVETIYDLQLCNNTLDEQIELLNDLDFTNQSMSLIKINYLLNGNNHTIKNLYINTQQTIVDTVVVNQTNPDTNEIFQDKQEISSQHMGMFIASNSSNFIKDIIIENVTFDGEYVEQQEMFVGLFFSKANTTFFQNVQTKDIILNISSDIDNTYIGGLIGQAQGKTEIQYSDIQTQINVLYNGNKTVTGGIVGQQLGVFNISSNKFDTYLNVTNTTQISGGLFGQVSLVGNILRNKINTTVYVDQSAQVKYFGGVIGSAENFYVDFNYLQNKIELYQKQNSSEDYIILNKTTNNFKQIGAVVGYKFAWCRYQNILTEWDTQSRINLVSSSDPQRCGVGEITCYLKTNNVGNVSTYNYCDKTIQFCNDGVDLLYIPQIIENKTISQCNESNIGQQCAQYAQCILKTVGKIQQYTCQCVQKYQEYNVMFQINQCIVENQTISNNTNGTSNSTNSSTNNTQTNNTDVYDYEGKLKQYENQASQNKSLMISTIISGSLALIFLTILIIYIIYLRKKVKIINANDSDDGDKKKKEDKNKQNQIKQTDTVEQIQQLQQSQQSQNILSQTKLQPQNVQIQLPQQQNEQQKLKTRKKKRVSKDVPKVTSTLIVNKQNTVNNQNDPDNIFQTKINEDVLNVVNQQQNNQNNKQQNKQDGIQLHAIQQKESILDVF